MTYASQGLINQLKTELIDDIIYSEYKEKFSSAFETGLFLHFSKISGSLNLHGFSDKILYFLKEFTKFMKHEFDFDLSNIAKFRQKYENKFEILKNLYLESDVCDGPLYLAENMYETASRTNTFDRSEFYNFFSRKTEETEEAVAKTILSLENLIQFYNSPEGYFDKNICVQAAISGNVGEEEALEIYDICMDFIKGPSRSKSTHKETDLTFHSANSPIFNPHQDIIIKQKTKIIKPTKHHKNSAIQVVYPIGSRNLFTDSVNRIFEEIVSVKVFDALRTKEQLGYNVSSGQMYSDEREIVGFSLAGSAQSQNIDESSFFEN